MNKRGFIDGFSFVVFIVVIGSVIGGTYSLSESQKPQHELIGYYVGDTITMNAYPYECSKQIPESQKIYFNSLDVVKQFNYTSHEACPK